MAPAVESVIRPGEEGSERESSPPMRGRHLYELSIVAPRGVGSLGHLLRGHQESAARRGRAHSSIPPALLVI